MATSSRSPETAGTFASLRFLYVALCIFRLVNAWLIQTQFDPDEYWQTLEPAYCEVFTDRNACAYTWEWTRRSAEEHDFLSRALNGPIRSYVSVLPTFLWYKIVQWQQWDMRLGSWVVSKGPMLVHAVLVAAPTDLCIWVLGSRSSGSQNSADEAWWALFCTLSSWFQGYAMIRTYSNSVEAMLLAVGMALLASELVGDQRSSRFFLRTCVAFWLGGLSVAVRFTALAAWVPLGVGMALQQYTSWKSRVRVLFLGCALPGVLGIVTATALDRWFYGFWTVPFLGSLHFNVLLGQGSLYGTHPVHWYVSSGFPAVTGLLLPLLLYDAWECRTARCTTAQRNIWTVIGSYTLLHSFSAHKEFRFLLPLLPLFCVRSGCVLARLMCNGSFQRKANGRLSQVAVVCLFAVPNALALAYLGMWHQRAPVDIQRQIRKHVSNMSTTTQGSYTVHYLLGCHATPLYSHLHIPGILFDAWTLDCSPGCRQENEQQCESERFHLDPEGFVESNYLAFHRPSQDLPVREVGSSCAASEDECFANTSLVEAPDLLVVMAGEASRLKDHILIMNLTEVARSFHGINGVRLGTFQLGDDFSNDAYRRIAPLPRVTWLELSLDEMILFAGPRQDTIE